MSAYFVPDNTMQNVVAAMLPCDDPSQLGRNLFELNRLAMVARYPQIRGTDEESGYIAARDSFVFDGRKCATYEEIARGEDAVSELHYQCAEGDLPETNELFARLSAVKELMRARLVEAKKAKRKQVSEAVKAYRDANPGKYLDTKETSKFLRTDWLKSVFPGVKFSVRQRRGGSVEIKWTNGPTDKQVNQAINALRAEKHEDGLKDEIVTLDGAPISLGFATYIFTYRETTESFEENCKAAVDAMGFEAVYKLRRKQGYFGHNHDDSPWDFIPASKMNAEALNRVQRVTF